MAIVVRPVTRSEFDQYEEVAMLTFGGEKPEGESRLHKTLALDRTYAAFDGSELVGTSGAYSHTLSIPGGQIPMAGFTFVSVRPSHRRLGVLRAMVNSHEEDMASRNEAVSGLWSSESSIYGRFGYGVAVDSYHLEADASHLDFLSSLALDKIRFIDKERAYEILSPVYAAAAHSRPGMVSRSENWWQNRTLHDGPPRRGSGSSLRIAVARRQEKVVGYVMFRQQSRNDRGLLDGEITIAELVGVDPEAEQSLWHFVCRLDLFPQVRYWNAPLDCPLPWIIHDRRRVRRLRNDCLWLRLRDVPTALAARTYAGAGSLRITLQNEPGGDILGRHTLEVANGKARCTTFAGEGEVAISQQDLASLYLGTFKPSELAAVRRLSASPTTVAKADALFAWPQAPWCAEIF
ncbi:MAG: GNAT family N-acetyltransferase [Myxococcales bacterium]|nr:GNAT family N-acetyltransferase [Myxococcales bacterium]